MSILSNKTIAALMRKNSQRNASPKTGNKKVSFKPPAGTLEKREALKSQELAAHDTSTVSGRLKKEMGIFSGDQGDPMTKDLIKGSQFGEAVLGEEGLGRLGDTGRFKTQDDGTMAAMKAQAAELAKGFSSEEMLARKEKGLELSS